MKKLFIILLLLVFSLSAASAEDYDFGALKVTLLNQDPDPAIPGSYVELRFKVEKQGNSEIEDIEFELEPNYPFSFDNSDDAIKDLGSWRIQGDSSEYYTLYYKLRVADDALEDSYNLSLVQRSNGLTLSQDVEIRVGKPQDIKLSIGSVKTSPQELVPDYDDGVLDVELVNMGEEDAYQVVAEMKLIDGVEESFGYSNRVSIGTLESGSSKTATFYMDTLKTLEQGVHETVLEITYKNNEDNTIEVVEVPFELRVFGKPQFDIIKSQVTESLVSGSQGEVFIELNNIGQRDADLVSIQIFKDSTQPFSFDERSDFIGKLDQGDNGQAVFNFDVDDGAQAKEYRLTMQIRSLVDGEVFVEEKELIIPVLEGQAKGSNFLIFIVLSIIVGCVLGFILGRKYKK